MSFTHCLAQGLRTGVRAVRNVLRTSAITATRRKLIAAAAAALALTVGAATSRANTTPPSDVFPIGVFLQPTLTFDAWQARGVNTVVECWQDWDLQQWNDEATKRGLYQIRAPLADPTKDINNKYLLAWSLGDEPDVNGKSAATVAAAAATMRKVDPARPLFVNFSAGNVLQSSSTTNKANYQGWAAPANWTGSDLYPASGYGRPDWLDFSKSITDRWTPGMAVDRPSCRRGRDCAVAMPTIATTMVMPLANHRDDSA